MQREVPVHYLRRNHAEWSPGTVAFADTETRTETVGTDDVLTLRLWAATLFDRRPPAKGEPRDVTGWGRTGDELVRWLIDAGRGRQTVWLFTHNLAFDLVTTRLPLLLIDAGWTLVDCAVSGKSPWFRLRRGSRRIVIADSTGWLPKPLADIGRAIGVDKPALPDEQDDEQAWLARCRADVAILAGAMCEVLDWWDEHGRGRWNVTGMATGWNAYRHTDTVQRVTIDPDEKGIAADRSAVYGGRRGVWRVGHQSAGPFLEMDFQAAYPSIAADVPLPIGRKRAFDSMPVDAWQVDHPRWGVIAEVEIDTDVPRWPLRVGKRTFYPTGRFRTVLCSPEIAEARRLGCLRAIGPGHVHALGVAHMDWARWVLDTQLAPRGQVSEAVRITAKHWGRGVIGKWAQHSWEKIELGPSPGPGWGYEDGWDHEAQQRGSVVDIAGTRWWCYAAGEGENTYPAVWAWVESAVRVRLGRLIDAVGAGAIVQCDTDGLIVAERVVGTRAARGHLVAPVDLSGPARTKWVLDCVDPIIAPLHVRVKRTSPHVTVLGPQHLATAGQRRLSGIPGPSRCEACESIAAANPRKAGAIECRHVEQGSTYVGRQWPSLQWQLAHGSPAGYVRPLVTSRLQGPYVAGWVLADGSVRPVEARLTADGESHLVPWLATASRRPQDRLRTPQHPMLDGLW